MSNTKPEETKETLKERIWNNRGRLIFGATAAAGLYCAFRFGFFTFKVGQNDILDKVLMKNATDSKDDNNIGVVTVRTVLDHMEKTGEKIINIQWGDLVKDNSQEKPTV